MKKPYQVAELDDAATNDVQKDCWNVRELEGN